MTSTGDLFTELESKQESAVYSAVALVIACADGKSTELIFAGDGDPVARLAAINALVRDGGHPVGFIGVRPTGKVHSWLLPNYRENEKVKAYMETVERESRMTILMHAGFADFTTSDLIV